MSETNLPAAPSEVSPDEFRAACGLFPSGVTVVTRVLTDGRPHGMTVSSFTSVSLDPPLILVCIDRSAAFAADLQHDLFFAVNVLSEDQQEIARRFAGKSKQSRFEGVAWHLGWNQVPLLSGIVTSFACSLYDLVEAGDHLIVIGSVRQIQRHRGRPLVWCERDYHYLPVKTPAAI